MLISTLRLRSGDQLFAEPAAGNGKGLLAVWPAIAATCCRMP